MTVSGVPVAAGTVVASMLHPTRLWSYVEVAADHRRQVLVLPCWMRCVIAAAHGQTTALV